MGRKRTDGDNIEPIKKQIRPPEASERTVSLLNSIFLRIYRLLEAGAINAETLVNLE